MSTDLCDTVDVLSLEGQQDGHCEYGEHGDRRAEDGVYEVVPGTLLHLFANSLILSHIMPYMSASGIVHLAATCRAFRCLLSSTPSVMRYLDMSSLSSANFQLAPIDRGGETWRNAQLDENVTEDDFYSGPLRAAFNAIHRSGWLSAIQTLVLDNLSVTADLVHDLLIQPDFNVRILSLRNVQHMNEFQLRQVLQYACRQSRPDGSPKLKGLYLFGGFKTGGFGVNGVGRKESNDVGGDVWYHRRGRVIPRDMSSAAWASTLVACRGVMAFDGVLCKGPHHYNSPAYGKIAGLDTRQQNNSFPQFSQFAMASHSIGGCAGCGSAPEGWTAWGDEGSRASSPEDDEPELEGGHVSRYPLLYPPPMHTSNLRAAMCPDGEVVHPRRYGRTLRRGSGDSYSSGGSWNDNSWSANNGIDASAGNGLYGSAESTVTGPARFIARCEWCVHDRLCYTCQRWWCEACMPVAMAATGHPDEGTSASSEQTYKPLIGYSCLECGRSCQDCIKRTQKRCRACRNIYCAIHNDGSSDTHCDWCCAKTARYSKPRRTPIQASI